MADQSEGRQTKLSRNSKANGQLPIINKTALKNKQNDNEKLSYLQKVSLVIKNIDYSKLSDKEIGLEFRQLKNQLFNINIQVATQINKIDIRKMKKNKNNERDTSQILDIKHREVQNNNQIKQRLKKQYFSLQKRVSAVSDDCKDGVEQEINKTKIELQKIKKKIKQLKLTNKINGDLIMNSDERYKQIQELQNDKKMKEKKKMKLKTYSQEINKKISQSEIKLSAINDGFLKALDFFEVYDGKNKINEQQQQLINKYTHMKQYLQMINHKKLIDENICQQKYKKIVKNLENKITQLNQLSQKMANIQLQRTIINQVLDKLTNFYHKNQLQNSKWAHHSNIFYTQPSRVNEGKQKINSKVDHRIDITLTKKEENFNTNIFLLVKRNQTDRLQEQQILERKQSLHLPLAHQINGTKDSSRTNNPPTITPPNSIWKEIQTNSEVDIQQEHDVKHLKLFEKFKNLNEIEKKEGYKENQQHQYEIRIDENNQSERINDNREKANFKAKVDNGNEKYQQQFKNFGQF